MVNHKNTLFMRNLKELEQKYLELGKEIEALKKQNTEKEEIKYPIYCKLKDSSLVVKFTDLRTGEVVVNNINHDVRTKISDYRTHKNNDVWQQLDVCEETGFFDGQLVWCWDNEDTHMFLLKFYDVKNKCTFTCKGNRGGDTHDNYEPFEGNYPDWALEAFKTLERD